MPVISYISPPLNIRSSRYFLCRCDGLSIQWSPTLPAKIVLCQILQRGHTSGYNLFLSFGWNPLPPIWLYIAQFVRLCHVSVWKSIYYRCSLYPLVVKRFPRFSVVLDCLTLPSLPVSTPLIGVMKALLLGSVVPLSAWSLNLPYPSVYPCIRGFLIFFLGPLDVCFSASQLDAHTIFLFFTSVSSSYSFEDSSSLSSFIRWANAFRSCLYWFGSHVSFFIALLVTSLLSIFSSIIRLLLPLWEFIIRKIEQDLTRCILYLFVS